MVLRAVLVAPYKLPNVCVLCLLIVGPPCVLWWGQQLTQAVDSAGSAEPLPKQHFISSWASTGEAGRGEGGTEYGTYVYCGNIEMVTVVHVSPHARDCFLP